MRCASVCPAFSASKSEGSRPYSRSEFLIIGDSLVVSQSSLARDCETTTLYNQQSCAVKASRRGARGTCGSRVALIPPIACARACQDTPVHGGAYKRIPISHAHCTRYGYHRLTEDWSVTISGCMMHRTRPTVDHYTPLTVARTVTVRAYGLI